jgi:hypothetical protein
LTKSDEFVDAAAAAVVVVFVIIGGGGERVVSEFSGPYIPMHSNVDSTHFVYEWELWI